MAQGQLTLLLRGEDGAIAGLFGGQICEHIEASTLARAQKLVQDARCAVAITEQEMAEVKPGEGYNALLARIAVEMDAGERPQSTPQMMVQFLVTVLPALAFAGDVEGFKAHVHAALLVWEAEGITAEMVLPLGDFDAVTVHKVTRAECEAQRDLWFAQAEAIDEKRIVN